MNEEDADSRSLVGRLVTIVGLTSTKGQALNGAFGKVIESESSPGRCPVLIYSTLADTVLDPPLIMSIKAENLELMPSQACEVFRKAARFHGSKLAEAKDYEGLAVWLEAYYERWPDDYMEAVTYANVLRESLSKPQEALVILNQAIGLIPKDSPLFDTACYDIAVTTCVAKGEPEEALKWALTISTDTPEKKQLADEALEAVVRFARSFYTGVDVAADDSPSLEIHKQAALALLERNKEDAKYMMWAAAALCLVNKNQDGAKLYRGALASGQLNDVEAKDAKMNLSLAQMQGPGGPMEDYLVVAVEDGRFSCIHKTDIGKYDFLTPEKNNAGDDLTGRYLIGIKPIAAAGIQIHYFDIPDPDDAVASGNADCME